jgi:alpha-1,2-mannosyltransferase
MTPVAMPPVGAGSGVSSPMLTRAMMVFLLLNAFVLNGILWAASPAPYRETVLNHTWDVLGARGCDDSWGIMSISLEYARGTHDVPLYSEIFFNRHLKFQYPPSSLLAIAGMLWMAGPEGVRTTECKVFDFPTLNDILGWLFILMSALTTAALLELGLRGRLTDDTRGLRLMRGALVIGFALTFYPVVKAYTLGQIQVWLNGMFGLALLAWVTGWKRASGVLIGLMCLVKPHYGLFLLWGALRREWRFTVASATAMMVGLAISVAAFGLANHLDYLNVLWYLPQHGEAFYPNHSFNGLLNRLMSLEDPFSFQNLVFIDLDFPPFEPLVYGGTLITSLIILSAALLRRGTEGDGDRKFDFCTMALSTTMASPIAWEHHYGIMLPIFGVMLAAVIADRRRLIWLLVCYVLVSNFFHFTNLLAFTPFNVAQSYLLAAAVVVLLMLHGMRPGWQVATLPAKIPVPSGSPAR